MMEKQTRNEKSIMNKPLIIIGLTIIFLIILSFLPNDLTVCGIKIKSVDILEDIKRGNSNEETNKVEKFEEISEESPVFVSASLTNLIYNNSIGNLIEDEISNLKTPSSSSILNPPNYPIEGNIKQLDSFFKALDNSKKSQIRIAHFGDSSLEGDLITAYLRNIFQKKFSGKGVGYLPITSQDISFRETTKIDFSDDWISISITDTPLKNIPIGIGGKVFLNSKKSWVEFSTIPKFRSIRNFNVIKIYYSNIKDPSEIKYSINGFPEVSLPIYNQNKINELKIVQKDSKSVKLTFPEEESIYLFGVSLEDTNGVYIDNLAIRGCSGAELGKIPEETLREFDEYLNYKLIIFEFGLNILSGRKTNFNKYEKEMTEVITKFKNSFPYASFLLISVHDKSVKKQKKFKTDPEIKKLVETQRKIANNTNIAFWNLFQAMGGENSIQNWVNNNPPFAYHDYTHFTSIGTKKEAEMLFESLMNANR